MLAATFSGVNSNGWRRPCGIKRPWPCASNSIGRFLKHILLPLEAHTGAAHSHGPLAAQGLGYNIQFAARGNQAFLQDCETLVKRLQVVVEHDDMTRQRRRLAVDGS